MFGGHAADGLVVVDDARQVQSQNLLLQIDRGNAEAQHEPGQFGVGRAGNDAVAGPFFQPARSGIVDRALFKIDRPRSVLANIMRDAAKISPGRKPSKSRRSAPRAALRVSGVGERLFVTFIFPLGRARLPRIKHEFQSLGIRHDSLGVIPYILSYLVVFFKIYRPKI